MSTLDSKALGFQTRAIHHGHDRAQHFGAMAQPIYMTSTFAFDTVDEAAAVFSGESDRYVYGRQHNPTQEALETRLASLEGAQAGVVFGSGMGAIGSVLMTLLSAGDELIVHHTMYSTATSLVYEGLPRFGIKITKVDLSRPEELAKAISPATKLVYFETPVNPVCEVLHIRALADIAHAAGARVVVDSTFGSPALQRPLEHGADIVVHSMTKYINGHGDLLGGAALGDHETMLKVRTVGLKYMTGSTLSPMLCFLVMRGLKTLALRMRQHSESALRIAQYLEAHPKVKRVRYPMLESSSGHEVAKQQMTRGGGMLAFELNGGFDSAIRVMDRLQLIARAISLGDTDSLIMHPGAFIRARQKVEPEARLGDGITMGLMRLSVGLEDCEDLLGDLEQALAAG